MNHASLIKFGSVCSGIEAASVAWESLGFSAAWVSEIDKFPCAVLAHHYPKIKNLGDMSNIVGMIKSQEIEAPEVLVGGTPCQAFSVAGLRAGLSDSRGQLTLKFVELANAIDAQRRSDGLGESIIVWENVPGVLSSKDNAFGCFLAGLAGESEPLEPPGGKWANAGCVFGPQRAIAWRVLDAQYFGLAQRRKRVFVVASARSGVDPTKILFEFDGVRRDSPPSRGPGQDVAGTLASRTSAGGFPGTDEALSGYLQVSCAITTRDESRFALSQPLAFPGNLSGTQFAAQVDLSPALGAKNPTAVAVGVTIHGTDPTVQKVASYDDTAQCLRARPPGSIENSSTTVVQQGMVVRRLTPKECEALQGFPPRIHSNPMARQSGNGLPRRPKVQGSWQLNGGKCDAVDWSARARISARWAK